MPRYTNLMGLCILSWACVRDFVACSLYFVCIFFNLFTIWIIFTLFYTLRHFLHFGKEQCWDDCAARPQLSKSNLGKVLILFWLKKKTSHPTKESWQWTLQLAQNAFTFKNFETIEILKSGISLTIECLHKQSSFIQKENLDKKLIQITLMMRKLGAVTLKTDLIIGWVECKKMQLARPVNILKLCSIWTENPVNVTVQCEHVI